MSPINRLFYLPNFYALFLLLGFSFNTAHADVVKPALIEISVHKSGTVQLEIRASIEAILSGINSRYKNTQEAPAAQAYDVLRIMSPQALGDAFQLFEAQFLSAIKLTSHPSLNDQPLILSLDKFDIPSAGYTQVPRISTLWLNAQLPANAQEISLYYPSQFSDYAVRVRQLDTQAEKWHWSPWEWVKSARPSHLFLLGEIYAKKSTFENIIEYIQLGFLHILPRGLDHILFILGLFLLCRSLSHLLWQVSMFTLAHTIALGLATAGYIELPARIVEPLIALSIAYIGFENIYANKLSRYRLAVVFAFGLLHGLGFASVLLEFKLPKDTFFTTLLSFNIGVECGQLAIISAAWLLFARWMSSPHYRRLVIIPGSLLIAIIGLIWTVERILI